VTFELIKVTRSLGELFELNDEVKCEKKGWVRKRRRMKIGKELNARRIDNEYKPKLRTPNPKTPNSKTPNPKIIN
jgi:hypothetical protein